MPCFVLCRHLSHAWYTGTCAGKPLRHIQKFNKEEIANFIRHIRACKMAQRVKVPPSLPHPKTPQGKNSFRRRSCCLSAQRFLLQCSYHSNAQTVAFFFLVLLSGINCSCPLIPSSFSVLWSLIYKCVLEYTFLLAKT